jgi:hypothetical protein
MDGDEKTCLPFSQVCFKERFLSLLIFIIIMLVVGPLFEEFVQLSILMDILWSAIFVSAIYAVSQKKRHIVRPNILSRIKLCWWSVASVEQLFFFLQ